MKKLIKLCLVLAITAGSIISCEKSANSPEPVLIDTSTMIDGVSVINGRIVFDSRETFENTYLSIQEKSYAELIEWKNENFQNYKSVLEAFENLTEEDVLQISKQESITGHESIAYLKQDEDGLDLVRTIDEDALALLSNENGVLQINDRVYYLQYDNTLEAQPKNETEIASLIKSKWNNENGIEIIIHPTTRTTESYSSGVERTVTCNQYYFRRNRRRFKHETTVKEGWLISGISSLVKHQAKIFGVWGNSKANKMRLRVSGTFFQEDVSLPGTGIGFTETLTFDTGLSSNVRKLKWTWATCFNVACQFTADGTSFFEGNGVDGSYRNCTRTFPNP